jgi:GNAT superfamily N-acetyltransferase
MFGIREAQKGDELAIMQLIKALALYEKAPEQVSNTAEELGKHLFEERVCDALVVEMDERIVGFALFYTNYSTWKGKCLYLEDFFVLPEFRRDGIGSKLFEAVVQIAHKRGVRRMDWQVLEWNEPALNFYRKKNAVLDSEWINGRLFFDK